MIMEIKGYDSIYVDDTDAHQTYANQGKTTPWLMHLVIKKRRYQLSQFTWCWDKLLRHVASTGKVETVQEYFGGGGRVTVMIQNLMKPRKHVVVELNDDCANHLQSLAKIYPICVRHENAYTTANEDVDFAVLDAIFTMLHLYKPDPSRFQTTLFDKVFALKPSYVELTDESVYRIHILASIYAKASGYKIVDEESYYDALSRILMEKYGYSITFVSRYHGGAAILLQPGWHGDYLIANAALAKDSRDFMVVKGNWYES